MSATLIPAFIKLLVSNDKELYAYLRGVTGYVPHNIALYKLALVHSSCPVFDSNGHPMSNERLEYLGDAVLDFVVGLWLYEHYPQEREGFLTRMRANIVKRDSLNMVAEHFNIEAHMRVSYHSTSHSSHIGGNAIEALVGALYLDRGIKRAARFIEKNIIFPTFNPEKPADSGQNSKSRIIEWAQSQHVTIEFRLIESHTDTAGDHFFNTAVLLGGICAGNGNGHSKKESHQNAARAALKRIESDTAFTVRVLDTANRAV